MRTEVICRTNHFEAVAFHHQNGDLDFISIVHIAHPNEFVDKLYDEDGAYGFSKWLEKRVNEPIDLDPEFSQFFANTRDPEIAKEWVRKASNVLDQSISEYKSLFSV
jgi:hypothetical protein